MTLRPNKSIQRALISTTSRLVGEYENEEYLITHAWPGFYSRNAFKRIEEGPMSRNAYIFSFKAPPRHEDDGTLKPLPDYSPMGQVVCIYLSILFGKRFDSHGLIEGIGYFHVPELTQFNYPCNHKLPQNSHTPRPDFEIPLNLVEFAKIERLLLDDTLDNRFIRGSGRN